MLPHAPAPLARRRGACRRTETTPRRLGAKLQEYNVQLPTVTIEYHNLTAKTDATVGTAGITTVGNLPLKVRGRPAQLLARGSLLGPRQDASLALTDFPAEMLQPLYRALPALQVGVVVGCCA